MSRAAACRPRRRGRSAAHPAPRRRSPIFGRGTPWSRPLPRPAIASSASTPGASARRPPRTSSSRRATTSRAVMDALGIGRAVARRQLARRDARLRYRHRDRRSGSPRSSGWRPAWPASTAGRPRARPAIEAEYERIDRGRRRRGPDRVRDPDLGRRSAPAGRSGGRSDPGPGLRDEPAAQRIRARRGPGDPARATRPRPPGGAALPRPAGGRQPRLLGRRRRRHDTSRPRHPTRGWSSGRMSPT